MGNLLGSEVNPRPPQNIFDMYSGAGNTSTGGRFLTALANNVYDYNNMQLMGSPAFPHATSPDINQGILPSVYSNWQPWNAGTGYMANFLGSPQSGQIKPQYQGALNNLLQYGGVGGYPTERMSNMIQYGGTGGPGNYAMSNLLQFGVPSAAGQGMADMAKSGVSGSWGQPLLSMATGAASPAMNYLSPFLTAKPYSSKRGG